MSLLRKTTKTYYQMSIAPSWILGMFVSFVLALVSLLGYFSPFISIVLTLLVSFPVIFASSLGHIASMNKEKITVGTQFKRGLSFFSINNSRCFRILPSMLFSLIVYFAMDVTITVILLIVFSVSKPGLFNEIYDGFLKFLTDPEIMSYEEALGENIIYFNYYRLFTVVPSSICAVTFFIYRVSLNSLSLYSKKTFGDSPMIFAINGEVFRHYKREIRKDYLSLNFPLFILFFVISIATMILLTIYVSIDADKVNALSLASGFLSLSFFLPFYFSNMEALYVIHEQKYRDSFDVVRTNLMNKMSSRMDLDEEQKKEFEDIMSKIYEDKDDDKSDEG